MRANNVVRPHAVLGLTRRLRTVAPAAPLSTAFTITKGILLMGLKDLFEGPHLVILIVVIALLFGWKRLPDAARGLGRSIRVFKSEVDEMKKDGKTPPSAASGDTVKGETVHPSADPNPKQAGDPTEREKHNQPPA
jgi:sec-independent protein translocase protein TatA